MDALLITSICAAGIGFLSFVLFYEFEIKIKPKLSIYNAQHCLSCGISIPELVCLEKCGHKMCKSCLDTKLRISPLLWQIGTPQQTKMWHCPQCKEWFGLDGKKLF